MSSHHTCKSSNWIKFLRQYGPIPRNDNMYDEAIQRVLKKQGNVLPIKFQSERLDELIDNFRSDSPRSVILTGTAGDGKTFYCREIWQGLASPANAWNSGKKIQVFPLETKSLTVVKDLSELTDKEKLDLLTKVADTITGSNGDEVYLIAANDGQLVEAWTKAAKENPHIQPIRKLIEDLLVLDKQEKEGFNLYLYNLSRLSAARIFPRILTAVMEHPGWDECKSCPHYSPPEPKHRCPIWENKNRLEGNQADATTKQRLIDLLELCELNGFHIPVRQMLLLIANSLLGHPDAKDKLVSCEEVPQLIAKNSTSLASLYRNLFGENLSERRRESTDVFVILNRFGIGNESSNRIDNTLIFGEDDPELKPYYEKLMLHDTYYGADQGYQSLQRKYLEGATLDEEEQFLKLLRAQRQRLFFTIPTDLAAEMKLWQLTTFQYAGEFLDNVYRALHKGERINKHIISRLVRGMNRIFTGLLVRNQDELILATSGSYSQARISRVFEEFISVARKRGESVSLEADADTGKPQLVVSLSTNEHIPKVQILLNLIRYEYLSRVSEGALPNSFSRECYEDILAFKTRVLRQLFARRQFEKEEGDADNCMMLRLIVDLDSDGMVHNPHSLEVKIDV